MNMHYIYPIAQRWALTAAVGISTLLLVFGARFLVPSVGAQDESRVMNSLGVYDTVRRLPVAANDVVYNAADGAVYASRPSRAGADGNSITRIDPRSGQIGQSVHVGSEPNILALSDDGHTLYTSLDGAFGVRRFDTTTGQAGLQFSIGRGQSVNAEDAPYAVADLAVVPGDPNRVAVARSLPEMSPPGAGVAIFENGIIKPQTSPSGYDAAMWVAFSPVSQTRIFGGGAYQVGLRIMDISANGVTDVSGPYIVYVRKVKADVDRVFDSLGHVIDPKSNVMLGTYPIKRDPDFADLPAFVPDVASRRVIFAARDNNNFLSVRAYDLNSFLETGSLTLPIEPGAYPKELIRYGSNGLALLMSNDQLILIQTSLIPTSDPLPAPSPTMVASPTPSPTPFATFIRSVPLANNDLIYRAVDAKLYASARSTAAGGIANRIVAIDPGQAAIEGSFAAGNEPKRMAFSGNEQTLYVGMDADRTVKRFDMGSRTSDLEFSLAGKRAYDMEVLPGGANAVAVSYGNTSYNYDGADIYDNGVKRPLHAGASGSVTIADANTMYVGEFYVTKYSIGPSGLTQVDRFSTGMCEPILIGNTLYTSGGPVIDLATKQYRGTLTGVSYWAGAVVDPANNRIFFLMHADNLSSAWVIKAFTLDTYLPVGQIALPGVSLSYAYADWPRRLIRWGVNGLAFTDYSDRIHILQSDLVSTAGTVPTALSFASANHPVKESDGSAAIVINRTGGLTGMSTVKYSTADGTAIAGTDYLAAQGTLTYGPGETSKTVTIPLVKDNTYEAAEKRTFTLTLSEATGGSIEIQGSNTATVTITDDDPLPLISVESIGVEEPGPGMTLIAEIPVRLSNPSIQTVALGYQLGDGTATSGIGFDYMITSGAVSFAPGETYKTISVTILGDSRPEPRETFWFYVTGVSNGNFRGSSQLEMFIFDHGGGVFPTPTPTATKTPTPSPTPTPFKVSITGNVSYYAGPKIIPGVQLNAEGAGSIATYANNSGSYSFNTLDVGVYTVTPSFSGGSQAISSQDAALIAQYAAGLINLSNGQLAAADTTDNGTVNSQDAARLAQFVAGLPHNSRTGQWRFAPSERTYSPLSAAMTAQNYEAFLIGDVTGNWSPSARPDLPNEDAVIKLTDLLAGESVELTILKNEAGRPDDPEIQRDPGPLSVDFAPTRDGSRLTIPLVIRDAAAQDLTSFDMDLRYDPAVMQLAGVSNVQTLASGFTVTTNDRTPGRLRISAYGTTPLQGSGTLLNLTFDLFGPLVGSAPLSFDSCVFNDDLIPGCGTKRWVR